MYSHRKVQVHGVQADRRLLGVLNTPGILPGMLYKLPAVPPNKIPGNSVIKNY